MQHFRYTVPTQHNTRGATHATHHNACRTGQLVQNCKAAHLQNCTLAERHAFMQNCENCACMQNYARMQIRARTHAELRTHARTHAERRSVCNTVQCMQHSASACNTAQRMQHSAVHATHTTQRSECNTAQRMHNGATLLYSRELWQFHAAQRNGTTIAPQRNFVRVDAAGCTSRCDSRRGIYVILCPATSCVCVCACVCVCSHELHERNCTPQCVCVCVGRIDNEITPH